MQPWVTVLVLTTGIPVNIAWSSEGVMMAAPTSSNCSSTRCPRGQVCEMAYRMGCLTGGDAECERYPACVPSNQSCSSTRCPCGQKCFLREVVCIQAPCYPVPQCEVECPKNEEWRECPSNCEPSCSNQSPMCNQACLLSAQCQCKNGFYRGPNATCVPIEQCGGDPTCATVSCDECKKVSKDCVCEMVTSQSSSKMFPRCIPKNNSCSASPCPAGKRCTLKEVTCVRAPCWPIRQCNSFSCPVNEEWRDCAAFCEPSCSSPAPLCPDVCKPGTCQCKENFFRRGSMCVSSSGCRGVPIQGPGGKRR
ncbi:hypothetical protein Q1695_001805 [Nippostrongylus brasiliensis]|nr:hypothetical protein Q1695_001805 [Nippostrongylus brasiliensis]